MRKFESFEDYRKDIIERGKLINKALNGMSHSEVISLLCASIDCYCASVGFDNKSTAEFYDQIATLGVITNDDKN